MKNLLKRLKSRFEALNRRERIFVAIASWLVVLFVLDAVAVAPARQQSAAMKKAVSQKQDEAARLDAELAGLRGRQSEDPDAQAKRRIADLENRIAAIDARLENVSSRIVPPDRMAGLLDQLLRRNKRLQLVSLRSLPPELLVKEEQAGKKEGAGKEPSQPQAGMLYRQGMELTLGGSYLDMLDYVVQLEQLPWKMYWERLELKVEEYPRAILRLQVYTLSMDKAWLSI
jgi:MSHA biogenesis protein MshJ